MAWTCYVSRSCFFRDSWSDLNITSLALEIVAKMESFEGVVKQQFLDKMGLFEWSRKVMRIDVFNASLEMADASAKHVSSFQDVLLSSIEKVSIIDAKYAKEWMFSTSLVGYGFDLAWKTGKISSFLVDDELECKSWVTYLNESIAILSKPEKTNESIDSNSFGFYSDVIDNSFCVVDNKGETEAAGNDSRNSRDPMSPSSQFMNESNRAAPAPDTSTEEPIKVQPQPKDNLNQTHQSSSSSSSDSSSNSSSSSNNNSSSGSIYIRNNYAKELGANKENENRRPPSETYLDLQRKYLLLEQALDNKTSELNSTQALLANLQKEMETRTTLLEKKLEDAWEKERNLRLESQNEIECRVFRAANENNSFYEATSQSIKIQHQRELSCLRDELHAERKKYTALFEKDSSYRTRAEQVQCEMRHELTSIRDQLNDRGIEFNKMADSFETAQLNWEREKKRLTSGYESKISMLTHEKETVVKNAQDVMYKKITELNKNFEQSMKEVHHADVGIVVQEMEGEKLRTIAELQRRYEKEVEMVRNEERKLSALEIDQLKGTFRKKEHQTIEDLIEVSALPYCTLHLLGRGYIGGI